MRVKLLKMARSRFERKAQKELEQRGYLVDWKIRPSGWKMPRGYNVDYFGLWDLMAYKFGEPIRFISIKGQAGVPRKHREEIEEFQLPEGMQKEIWTYRKLASNRRKFVPRKEIIK